MAIKNVRFSCSELRVAKLIIQCQSHMVLIIEYSLRLKIHDRNYRTIVGGRFMVSSSIF
jgi:hypothetical protein